MPGLCQPPRARVQGIPASSLMRLLADENFPLPTIETLRNAGHDVTWVRTDHPGAKDAALLELVESDRRVLVTDKDFWQARCNAVSPSNRAELFCFGSIRPFPTHSPRSCCARSQWINGGKGIPPW